MRPATKVWLEIANRDLRSATLLIQDSVLTPMVAFHAQQVVEKSMKSLLEEKEEKIPRTHDLVRLFTLCHQYWSLELDQDMLRLLGTLYIETRYPSEIGLLPSGRPTESEARRFVDFARETLDTVRQMLSE